MMKRIIAQRNMENIGALDMTHFVLKTINFTEQWNYTLTIDELTTIYSLHKVYHQYDTHFMQITHPLWDYNDIYRPSKHSELTPKFIIALELLHSVRFSPKNGLKLIPR